MRKRWQEKTLYLTKEENEILMQKSKEANLTQSEYLRQLIKNYNPIKADISILTQNMDKIRKINNLLNIYVRQAHMYNYIDYENIKKLIGKINLIKDDIMFNLKKKNS